ncbi:MAG: hypothetical protein VXA41_06815 [Euryarchaeota archaeon]
MGADEGYTQLKVQQYLDDVSRLNIPAEQTQWYNVRWKFQVFRMQLLVGYLGSMNDLHSLKYSISDDNGCLPH